MLKKIRAAAFTSVAVALLSCTPAAFADESFDVLRSYYDVDHHLPLDVQVLRRSQLNSEETTDFTFASFDNEPVRARLAVPDPAKYPGRRPVVVLLHGITQSLDQWWRLDVGPYSFPSAHRQILTENGFAVLAIDQRSHGARQQPHDFASPSDYLDNGYLEAVRKMISQSAIDVRRAIDTVDTFPELDPENVTIVGFSLGAWAGFLTTAVDDRVKRAVFIGLPFLPATHGGTHFISQFEYTEGLIGRPIHLVAGTEDTFYAKDDVARLLSAIGESASVTWVESGHDFPRATSTLTLEHLKNGQ